MVLKRTKNINSESEEKNFTGNHEIRFYFYLGENLAITKLFSEKFASRGFFFN